MWFIMAVAVPSVPVGIEYTAVPESVCLGKAYRPAGLPTKHTALIIWTRYAWCQEAAILLTQYCTFQPKAVTILSENKSKAR